ncbi:hypothetical protein COCNU_scaffold008759G000020 [Cocos nucifera]|nr:hypothetical protein [Cocos nucifera]EHA8589258.1 hypothetical protein [Cocos nucifera]
MESIPTSSNFIATFPHSTDQLARDITILNEGIIGFNRVKLSLKEKLSTFEGQAKATKEQGRPLRRQGRWLKRKLPRSSLSF